MIARRRSWGNSFAFHSTAFLASLLLSRSSPHFEDQIGIQRARGEKPKARHRHHPLQRVHRAAEQSPVSVGRHLAKAQSPERTERPDAQSRMDPAAQRAHLARCRQESLPK